MVATHGRSLTFPRPMHLVCSVMPATSSGPFSFKAAQVAAIVCVPEALNLARPAAHMVTSNRTTNLFLVCLPFLTSAIVTLRSSTVTNRRRAATSGPEIGPGT